MFVDCVTLKLSAGKGGNGIVAWKRAKYIPKGGPGGGDGGDGGHVYVEASKDVLSLDAFAHKRHIKAESGRDGGSNCKTGRRGKNLTLPVPIGTLIKDSDTREVLHDLTEDGQKILLLSGGRGGRGNDFFKTPTNRTPRKCTPGKAGEEFSCELELKLIADIGLIGMPNAGKSTLLTALTSTPVKIGAYPFTTLTPNLSFITTPEKKRLYIADIPGIIEGAHRNRGRGFAFLRHIERTHVLVIVLDGTRNEVQDPVRDYKILLDEMQRYNPHLLEKPTIIALNKSDLEEFLGVKAFAKEAKLPAKSVFPISAMEGVGISRLKEALFLC